MLSFGIRFGDGFDRASILKLMQAVPTDFNYDLLVLGSSPGGIACAREAKAAGKKSAIVRWTTYSAAEEEGYDEDLVYLSEVLEDDDAMSMESDVASHGKPPGVKQRKPTLYSAKSFSGSKSTIASNKISNSEKSGKRNIWSRKIRQSRLDLNNELYKRGREGRKLMLKAATYQNSLYEAMDYGWRINPTVQKLTINWKKMSEVVMDYIMQENWSLMNALGEEEVEIVEGKPTFVNNHTVRIQPKEGKDYNITARVICAAPLGSYVLPNDIPGATDFGITCDDFIRLNEPPGRTLIVGSTPEGLECAGILACLRIPVVVIDISDIMAQYDTEMSNMVLHNLRSKGVIFKEKMSVSSIRLTRRGTLLVSFVTQEMNSNEPLDIPDDEFDTVTFATGKCVQLDQLNLARIGIDVDPTENKICTNVEDETTVSNIYALGDAVAYHPQSDEISEVVGKLLGKRLYHEQKEVMDYSMLPYAIITPIEYAFVGLSEDGAIKRFGKECIDIFRENFTPIEFASSYSDCTCKVKAIVFKPKNLIIGLHMFGPYAGEIIQGFAGAIKLGMAINQLQTFIRISATNAQEIIKLKKLKTI